MKQDALNILPALFKLGGDFGTALMSAVSTAKIDALRSLLALNVRDENPERLPAMATRSERASDLFREFAARPVCFWKAAGTCFCWPSRRVRSAPAACARKPGLAGAPAPLGQRLTNVASSSESRLFSWAYENRKHFAKAGTYSTGHSTRS